MFDLLELANSGETVLLPDPSSILPYLGLFTLVVLNPAEVCGRRIVTPHQPELSLLQTDRFEAAPDDISPMADNTARIFDIFALEAKPPLSYNGVPLSPQGPEFEEKRYWLLPVSIGGVLASLIARLEFYEYQCEEIFCAQEIGMTLLRQRCE